MVSLSNWAMAAGLLATTAASLATALPALARPSALALFSRSWKPEALAWPAASVPRMASASAVARKLRELVYIESSPETLAAGSGLWWWSDDASAGIRQSTLRTGTLPSAALPRHTTPYAIYRLI
jgi:hypothetical protein